MRKMKETGYSVATLKRRLRELENEVVLMGQDGRLSETDATKVRVGLLMALKDLKVRR